MNEIRIGNQTVTAGNIVSGTLTTSHSLAGEELSADTLTATFESIDVSSLKTNDPVILICDGIQVGKYYLQKTKQISATRHQIEAVSAIGLLSKKKHYGGVYADTPASEIFSDLLKGYAFSVDSDLAKSTVTGYLPIANCRENLQQTLFVTGGAVFQKENGELEIKPMPNVYAGEFTPARCFNGGTVEDAGGIDAVELTEHNFFQNLEEKVLFEDGVLGEITVEFSEPHHSYSITGGQITESGANFVKISASGMVQLRGQSYTHITRPVLAGKKNDIEDSDNVQIITDATLANPQIAQTLAERMFRFLSKNRRIRQDVLFGQERAGNLTVVTNPFSLSKENAVLAGLDLHLSGINRASAEFLVGYAPEGVVSGYKNYAFLSGSGTWTVPDVSAGTIRLILVQGGTGGSGGEAGDAGTPGDDGDKDYRSVATAGTGGEGGEGGDPGKGGAIFEITVPVIAGQTFSYSVGIGGVGGNGGTDTTEPTKGTAGTHSRFGEYSSAFGLVPEYGYTEIKTGQVFSTSGTAGVAGAAGGNGGGGNESFPGAGSKGEKVGAFKGGNGGESSVLEVEEWGEATVVRAGGGGGGGAARGSAGGDGQATTSDSPLTSALGGNGGDGGIGAKGATPHSPGSGGNGGNGGGGAGGGGACFFRSFAEATSHRALSGKQGTPGKGGGGGNGADGIIVIYY